MDFAKKGSTGVLVEWIKIGRKKNGLQNNYDLLSKLLVVLARFFILSAPPFDPVASGLPAPPHALVPVALPLMFAPRACCLKGPISRSRLTQSPRGF